MEPSRVDDFLANRREFAEAALETSGIMSSMTLANNDSGSAYCLTFLRAIDREAVNELLESPRLA